MDDPTRTSEVSHVPKATWQRPELTVHGGFEELTRFTSGTGPDDGLFDPGADSSVA